MTEQVQVQHKSLHCQFPAEIAEIATARSFVRLSCMSFNCTDSDFIADLELLVNEAFSIIVAQTGASIIIECKKMDHGVAVRLFDQGEPQAPHATPAPNDETPSGRRLKIIHTIADEIKFIPKTDKVQWNQLHLFKRYGAKL